MDLLNVPGAHLMLVSIEDKLTVEESVYEV